MPSASVLLRDRRAVGVRDEHHLLVAGLAVVLAGQIAEELISLGLLGLCDESQGGLLAGLGSVRQPGRGVAVDEQGRDVVSAGDREVVRAGQHVVGKIDAKQHSRRAALFERDDVGIHDRPAERTVLPSNRERRERVRESVGVGQVLVIADHATSSAALHAVGDQRRTRRNDHDLVADRLGRHAGFEEDERRGDAGVGRHSGIGSVARHPDLFAASVRPAEMERPAGVIGPFGGEPSVVRKWVAEDVDDASGSQLVLTQFEIVLPERAAGKGRAAVRIFGGVPSVRVVGRDQEFRIDPSEVGIA